MKQTKEDKFVEKQFQKMAKGIADVVETEDGKVIIEDFYFRNIIRDAIRIGYREWGNK